MFLISRLNNISFKIVPNYSAEILEPTTDSDVTQLPVTTVGFTTQAQQTSTQETTPSYFPTSYPSGSKTSEATICKQAALI